MKKIIELFTQKDKIIHIISGALISYFTFFLGINFGLYDLRPFELFILGISLGTIIGYGFEYYFQPVYSGRNSKYWFWVFLDKLNIVPQKFKTIPDVWDVVATVIGFAIGVAVFITTVNT